MKLRILVWLVMLMQLVVMAWVVRETRLRSGRDQELTDIETAVANIDRAQEDDEKVIAILTLKALEGK